MKNYCLLLMHVFYVNNLLLKKFFLIFYDFCSGSFCRDFVHFVGIVFYFHTYIARLPYQSTNISSRTLPFGRYLSSLMSVRWCDQNQWHISIKSNWMTLRLHSWIIFMRFFFSFVRDWWLHQLEKQFNWVSISHSPNETHPLSMFSSHIYIHA